MCGFARLTRAAAPTTPGVAGPAATAQADGLPIRFSCAGMASYRRDTDALPPRAKIDKALAALVPAALVAWFLFAFVPQLSWLVFALGWTLFPAVALLARGLAGMAGVAHAGSSPARTLRGLVDAGRRRVREIASPSQAAAIDQIDARMARLWRAARGIEAPAVRADALRVCEAADRLVSLVAALEMDARTAHDLLDRALAPAETLLASYARLAADRFPAAEPTLVDVESRGLTLLADKLDALTAGLRPQEEGGPPPSSGPAA